MEAEEEGATEANEDGARLADRETSEVDPVVGGSALLDLYLGDQDHWLSTKPAALL